MMAIRAPIMTTAEMAVAQAIHVPVKGCHFVVPMDAVQATQENPAIVLMEQPAFAEPESAAFSQQPPAHPM